MSGKLVEIARRSMGPRDLIQKTIPEANALSEKLELRLNSPDLGLSDPEDVDLVKGVKSLEVRLAEAEWQLETFREQCKFLNTENYEFKTRLLVARKKLDVAEATIFDYKRFILKHLNRGIHSWDDCLGKIARMRVRSNPVKEDAELLKEN